MPNLCRISFLVCPLLLGELGRSPIWILPLCSTRPLKEGISLDVLTLFYSLVIVGLPFYSPEYAPLGSPFVIYVTTLGAHSLLALPYWICRPYCTLPGSCTKLLNSTAWFLLAF